MNTQTHKTNWGYLSIGIVGLLLISFAVTQPVTIMQKSLIAAGCFLLMLSAILEKNVFFAILEVIALLGAGVAFLPLNTSIKIILFSILGIISVIYLLKKGILKGYIDYLGGAGLIFLALGFAISNPLVYLIGGIFLTIYSLSSFLQGSKIALIFTLLNVIFVITSGIGVYHIL